MIVAVAVPSYSGWHPSMALSMTALVAHATRAGIDLAILSAHRTQIATARNQLVRMAQERRAEWLLFVDDDMIFPGNALARLLAHDRDVVGVMAPSRTHGRTVGEASTPLVSYNGLILAHRLGAGILLIRMSVFDRMPLPWFKIAWGEGIVTDENRDGEIYEDYLFCREAQKAGVELWYDRALSLEIGHVGEHTYRLAMSKKEPIT
jgi:glycosyltransferase involved in cell wall biosynthesis